MKTLAHWQLPLFPLVFLSIVSLCPACGSRQKVADKTAIGVEVPPEAGADQGETTPQGKVSITDAEMKAAAKAAKRAQRLRQRPASSSANQAGRRGMAAPKTAPEEPDDPADPAETKASNLPPEEEDLPRDPSPPSHVPAPADVASAPPVAECQPSGLCAVVLHAGTGAIHPTPGSKVVVHYSGWTTNGKMFDSSVVRGVPLRIGLGNVIPGWREGVMHMVVGEKRRLWIPEKLAYAGRAGAPAGPLVFDVELLRIE